MARSGVFWSFLPSTTLAGQAQVLITVALHSQTKRCVMQDHFHQPSVNEGLLAGFFSSPRRAKLTRPLRQHTPTRLVFVPLFYQGAHRLALQPPTERGENEGGLCHHLFKEFVQSVNRAPRHIPRFCVYITLPLAKSSIPLGEGSNLSLLANNINGSR